MVNPPAHRECGRHAPSTAQTIVWSRQPMIVLLQRSAIFGACLSLTATLSVAPACADPNDYSFELTGVDQSIVIVSLKNKLNNQLVPGASIDCAAYVGPQGVVTMTEPMLASAWTKKG